MKKLMTVFTVVMAIVLLATVASAATLRWGKVTDTTNCIIADYKVHWMQETQADGAPVTDPSWQDISVGNVDSLADIITALSMTLDATYQITVSAVSDQGTEGPQATPIRWIATDQAGEIITIPGQVKTITINFE